MKKFIFGSLKVVIPLGLGLFLVWWFVKGLSEEDKNAIFDAFGRANYLWVWLSMIPAVLSHLSRSYRWKYTLEPLGYKPDLINATFSVFIGYLMNLAVPRLGEITRCGVMRRYDKIPFESLLGTVIAERVADLIILLVTTTTVIFLQYAVIQDLLNELLSSFLGKVSGPMVLTILGVLFVGGIGTLVFIYKAKSSNKVITGIQSILKNVVDGVLSIINMKQKWAFIFHTVFIWLMYFFMFYICFFSLPETSDVPFAGVLTGFVLGGITIATTNGGIGAYPLAIQAILVLYSVDSNVAGAFGWIVWTAQTLLILVTGTLAFTLMPVYNKYKNERLQQTAE